MLLQKQKTFFVGLLLVLGLSAFATPLLAQGRGLVPCGGYSDDKGTMEPPCKFTDIFALVARVTNWLIATAGLFAVYEIISAGFGLIVFAQGEEEAITKGKKTITNAIVGLVLVMLAYMIINTAVNIILANGKDGFKVDLKNPVCYLAPTTQDQCFVPAKPSTDTEQN